MDPSMLNVLQDPNRFFDHMNRDPYEVYDFLIERGPIHWIEPLSMWYVVDQEIIRQVLLDSKTFTTGAPGTLIYDTFGRHMLTVDGPDQIRYRSAFRSAFSPAKIKQELVPGIESHVDTLIESFSQSGRIELREAFASRLPIQVILDVFGLPSSFEKQFRLWYDHFEKALANFEDDKNVRRLAEQSVAEFHDLMQVQIDRVRSRPDSSLLSSVVNQSGERALSDEEIRRNTLIILFGGISTVEAVVLNTLYLILSDDKLERSLRSNWALLPDVIEESIRLVSPVQSATRHVLFDTELGGQKLKAGDTLNCMLGAANRSSDLFEAPSEFRKDRTNLNRHLGFATGPHVCLGNNLARTEAKIALERLMQRLDGIRLIDGHAVKIRGYEFRQPKSLWIEWKA